METLHTGRAAGADRVFEVAARKAGHRIAVHTFSGGNSALGADEACMPSEPNVYGQNYENDLYARTRQELRRAETRDAYTRKLLLRNVQLATSVTSIYAVGKPGAGFSTSTWSLAVGIDGGTAWACQAFRSCACSGNLYFFDQEGGKWYWYMKRAPTNDALGKWVALEVPPPRPTGRYGGIGTRDLNERGRAAIVDLYRP